MLREIFGLLRLPRRPHLHSAKRRRQLGWCQSLQPSIRPVNAAASLPAYDVGTAKQSAITNCPFAQTASEQARRAIMAGPWTECWYCAVLAFDTG